MKSKLTAGLAILVVMAGVGWKLTGSPGTSSELRDIQLLQYSEHAYPGPSDALAGIRIRLSPSDFDDHVLATAHEVPRITVAVE